jgi:hypothetical protein
VVKKEKRKKIPLQENLKEQNSTALNLCFYCLPLPFLTLSNLTTVLFRKMSQKDVIEKQKHQIHLKKKGVESTSRDTNTSQLNATLTTRGINPTETAGKVLSVHHFSLRKKKGLSCLDFSF